MLTKSLSVLLMGTSLFFAGCSGQGDGAGTAEDAVSKRPENFGGGLGREYNDMLDTARQSVEQTNQQAQETEQRIREAR